MPSVALNSRVEPAVHAMARSGADELGVSMAIYIELLVRADAEQYFVRPTPEAMQETLEGLTA